MFKLLVIDNEVMVRSGLEKIINWKQLGCEMVGAVSDGEEALAIIKNEEPDIVITEIDIPKINGIDLIRETLQMLPDCKIIIFTAVKDFNIVLEAMKLGVLDILIKPTKLEEINKILAKAVKKLNIEKERKDEVVKLRRVFEENVPELREKLLHDIMYSLSSYDIDLNEKMKIFNMRIGKFILILIGIDYSDKVEYVKSNVNSHQIEVVDIFFELLSKKFSIYKALLSDRQIAFIMQDLEKYDDYYEIITNKCESIYNIIKNCFAFNITISISDEGFGPYDISDKYNICSEAMKYKNYIENGSIISFKDSFKKLKDYSKFDKVTENILESIKIGNEQTVIRGIREFTNSVENLLEENESNKKKYYFRLIQAIYDLSVEDISIDNTIFKASERTNFFIKIEECDNLNEINRVIEEVALTLSKKINNFNKKKIKLSLKKAVDFINENYKEQITLNQVAEHIYLSPYYISRLFKKELGKNFSEYLIEVRIEKAKELLKDIRYKIYEIADMVGIQDAHYFSRIFKKYVLLSPSEYRDLNVNNV